VYLRRQGIYTPQPGWLGFGARVAIAVAAMAGLLYYVTGPSAWWLHAVWQHKVAATAGLVALGAVTYGVLLLLMGFRLRDFARREAG
jgi:putative peptidoglycan lipid II flippase